MKQIRLLMMLGCFAWFASCSQDDESGVTPTGTGDIRFEIAIAQADSKLKVATGTDFKSAFETGDKIGLFAVVHGDPLTPANNPIHNMVLEYNSGAWTGTAYWANNGDKYDLYAYYPYDDNSGSPQALNPTNIIFNVKADQSTAANYSLSDLLTAKATNGTGYSKGETVTLTFSHTLSMIEITLDNTTGAIDPNEAVTVKLRNVKTASTLNLSTQTAAVSTTGDAAEIQMHKVAGLTYRALVPVQTIAEGLSICRVTNGGLLVESPRLAADLTTVKNQAEQYTRKLPKYVHIVSIPAGKFIMGSPTTEPKRQNNETQHEVTLTKPYTMGKYQVTNAQYAAFLNANGIPQNGKWTSGIYPNMVLIKDCSTVGDGIYNWGLNWDSDNSKWVPVSGKENHTVIYVTWYGADEYARWVGGKLPTEAQWEYACRGAYDNKATEVNTMPFGVGTGKKLTGNMANFHAEYPYDLDHSALGHYYDSGASSLYKGGTTSVGYYSDYANNYGLYDMHGNVYEWCEDKCDRILAGYDSSPIEDPVGTTGSQHVVRGGFWRNSARYCRSAYRISANPDNANNNISFRVVFVP